MYSQKIHNLKGSKYDEKIIAYHKYTPVLFVAI